MSKTDPVSSSSDSLDVPARVRWHCRRGMLELDILLLGFFDTHYADLSRADQKTFQALLTYHDPILFTWLLGQSQPTDPALVSMIDRIRAIQH